MKRFPSLLIFVGLVFGIYSEDQFLWCTKLFQSDPGTHVIQKGEYFSKLSLRYYGNETYWRELALINRAPNSNLVFPGEEIIVPSLEAIQKVRKARSLSSVNRIVEDQEIWIAKHRSSRPTELAAVGISGQPTGGGVTSHQTTSDAQTNAAVAQRPPASAERPAAATEPKRSSSFLVLILIASVVVVSGLIAFFIYRARRRRFEEFEEVEEDDGRRKRTLTVDELEDTEDVLPGSLKDRHKEPVLVS